MCVTVCVVQFDWFLLRRRIMFAYLFWKLRIEPNIRIFVSVFHITLHIKYIPYGRTVARTPRIHSHLYTQWNREKKASPPNCSLFVHNELQCYKITEIQQKKKKMPAEIVPSVCVIYIHIQQSAAAVLRLSVDDAATHKPNRQAASSWFCIMIFHISLSVWC